MKYYPVRLRSTLVGMAMVLLLAGCQLVLPDASVLTGQGAVPQSAESDAASSEASESPAANPTEGTSILTLQPPTAGESLSADEIYARIASAIAFVDTPTTTGSGLFIEGNYLLTSAHAVWPYSAARVFFADGSEYTNVPVHGWDLVADLALLGPIESSQTPLPLVDGTQLPIGSDAYLIGYPSFAALFSQPQISSGTISAIQPWARADYTFFEFEPAPDQAASDEATSESDSPASASPALSGLLVSSQGDVIGLSAFAPNDLVLAGALTTAVPRIDALLATAADGTTEGETVVSGTLIDDQATVSYQLNPVAGEQLSLALTGDGQPQLYAIDLMGNYLGEAVVGASDEATNLPATLALTVTKSLPIVITVYQPTADESQFSLESSLPLQPYADTDDGQSLSVGEQLAGSLENASDADLIEVELTAGQNLRLYADSLSMAPEIVLEGGPGNPASVASEQKSDNAPGESAELLFEAPADGTYTFRIKSDIFGRVGGYLLTVEDGDQPASAAATEDTRAASPRQSEDTQTDAGQGEMDPAGLDPYSEEFSTRYGLMGWYESDDGNFSLLRPAEWEARTGDECNSPGATVCFVGGALGMIVTEEALEILPRTERNRDGYINLLWTIFEENPGVEVVSFAESRSLQKRPIDTFVLTSSDGEVTINRMLFVDEENGVAFSLTMATSTEVYAEVEPFVDFIHNSFRTWDGVERSSTAVYHLDQGMVLTTQDEDDAALAALTQAIELDPTLVQAYQWRWGIYQQMGDLDAAVADLDTLIELEPRDSSHLYSRAVLLYDEGNLTDALTDMDQAITVEPEEPENHNMKALIYAEQGDYQLALDELEINREKNGGELAPNVLDTRGFVYLRMGEFAKAQADYEAIFAQDIRFGYAIIGAGIAAYGVGETDEGIDLINEGLAEFTEEALADPDPQLRALLEMANEILAGAE